MIKKHSFSSAMKYLVEDELVKNRIHRAFGEKYHLIISALASGLTPDGGDVDLETFLYDLLHNEARLYKRFNAKGSYGKYPINILGLGGVYFYKAPEFDAEGYFFNLEDASNAVVSNWTDSLVSSSGRSFRTPFNNPAIEAWLKAEDHQAQILKSECLLNEASAVKRLFMWRQLLQGGTIESPELGAKLAAFWVDDADKEPQLRHTLDALAMKVLPNGAAVVSVLPSASYAVVLEKLKWHAFENLRAAAHELLTAHGIAAMSARSRLATAIRTADVISGI